MPLPSVPNVIRCAVRTILGDDNDCLNIYHLKANDAGPYAPGDLLTIATDFLSIWAANFFPLLSESLSLASATAKDLTIEDGAEATFVPSPDSGAITGNVLPANVALCVSWKESLSYRGGHPRSYLPGIPASEQSDAQHVSNTYANNVQAAANTFIGDIAGHTWPIDTGQLLLCVVHYRLNDTVQVPPKTELIMSALCNTRYDSQRRRLQS